MNEATEPQSNRKNVMLIAIVLAGLFALLIAALYPAVLAAREAANRMSARNNIKQIGLAIWNYVDANRHFPPPVTYDKQGEPAYSWRLAIIPYIEANSLFNEYDRAVAWNSPHNMKVSAFRMPFLHRQGSHNRHQFATNFVLVTGPGTFFPPEGPKTIDDVTDGASETILIVEIDNSDIPWHEPRDLDIANMSFRISDPDRSRPCIGNQTWGGALVGMVDGSVRHLPADTPPETLKAMLTIAGGEELDLPDINSGGERFQRSGN